MAGENEGHDGTIGGATESILGLFDRLEDSGESIDAPAEQEESTATDEDYDAEVEDEGEALADDGDEAEDEADDYEADDDDNADEADDEAEDDSAPQTYTVKVDGDEFEVSLDEALAGYQRQKAFTQRTQELAEQRKTIQAESDALRGEREAYQANLGTIQQFLATVTKEPDWDALKTQDPGGYADAVREYQQRQTVLKQIAGEQQRVQQESQEATQKARQEYVVAERDQMLAAIPEWVDEDIQAKEVRRMTSFAGDMGFSPEELGSVVDHRNVVLLRKAMLYDEMVAQGAKVTEKATKKSTKALKPGQQTSPAARKARRNSQKRNTARKRLAKSGRIADATAAFLEMEGAI